MQGYSLWTLKILLEFEKECIFMRNARLKSLDFEHFTGVWKWVHFHKKYKAMAFGLRRFYGNLKMSAFA